MYGFGTASHILWLHCGNPERKLVFSILALWRIQTLINWDFFFLFLLKSKSCLRKARDQAKTNHFCFVTLHMLYHFLVLWKVSNYFNKQRSQSFFICRVKKVTHSWLIMHLFLVYFLNNKYKIMRFLVYTLICDWKLV